jgi:hypothetical protein
VSLRARRGRIHSREKVVRRLRLREGGTPERSRFPAHVAPINYSEVSTPSPIVGRLKARAMLITARSVFRSLSIHRSPTISGEPDDAEPKLVEGSHDVDERGDVNRLLDVAVGMEVRFPDVSLGL